MKQVVLYIAVVLVAWVPADPAPAARPLQGLSVSDLGLGLPKKEAQFEPGWSVGVGVVFLHRSASSSLVLAESPPPESASLVSASDIGLGFEGGPIVSFAKQMNETTTAEISYFGIGGWGGSTTTASLAGIATSRFDIGSTLLDQVDASYGSRIDNVEVNMLRSLSARFWWLAGFRWTGLDESAQVAWDGRLSGTDFCSASMEATNDLYGAQLGVGGAFWEPSARFHVDGFFKAGVLANHMSTRRNIAGTFSTITSVSRSVDRTSFLGEFGLLGTFDFTERISLSGGYQVLWLDGVATAFAPLGGPDVDSTFYHGPRLIFQLEW